MLTGENRQRLLERQLVAAAELAVTTERAASEPPLRCLASFGGMLTRTLLANANPVDVDPCDETSRQPISAEQVSRLSSSWS